jgi:anti-sigma factor RsiW
MKNNKAINSCSHIRAQMSLYLDDELHYQEQSDFELHLNQCVNCRALYEQEKTLLESVRAARPLYKASPELQSRVAEILKVVPEPYTASHSLRQRIGRVLKQNSLGLFSSFPRRRAVAFAILVVCVITAGIVFWSMRRNLLTPSNKTSDFAMMAAETHLRHLRGGLPLEIVTNSPEKITAWFAGKVSFTLKLPNYQEASGQDKLYDIEGARLVAFNNDYAAHIAYQMNKRPISLIVTSNSVAQPSGGLEIVSKGITFHYDSINGQKVITWTDRGLTYALVSDLEERGQQSCIVCHTGTKDRDFIEDLKPSKSNQ